MRRFRWLRKSCLRTENPLALRRLVCVLLSAWWTHAAAAGDFEFVVIGDTRPHFESESFRIFESLISKINAAKPAFVINLGDLIYGYGPLRKQKQWDKYQQVIKGIQAPYHQIPGNHDTYSKEARRVYERRFGNGYRSFDAGDWHFVLLDDCQEGRWGYMGPSEIAWLQADLKETKAKSVFAFMHVPVWEPERVLPQAHDFWVQSLHPMFKQSRVRAVFGGHFHAYGPTREFDGIRYFITGGGGAELKPEYKKAGGVHHFLKVKITGDHYEVRVVTDQGEFTDAEADVMGGLLFADRHASRIGLKHGYEKLAAGVPCSITLTNPYPEFLVGKAEWMLDATAFSVEPNAISVHVPPGGMQRADFTLKARQPAVAIQSLPRLEFNVASGARRHRFYREIRFLRELNAPHRPAPFALGARSADWAGAPSLRLGESPKFSAEIRAVHDGEILCLTKTRKPANLKFRPSIHSRIWFATAAVPWFPSTSSSCSWNESRNNCARRGCGDRVLETVGHLLFRCERDHFSPRHAVHIAR